MEKKSTAESPSPAASSSTDELVALLLQVMRNVDREVKTALELGTEAQAAVARFRAISADLATRPVATFANAPQPSPSPATLRVGA